MATLTVQTIDKDGAEMALVAAAGGGDEFANTGKEFMVVTNGDGTATEVTFATQSTVDGLAIADRVVDVPAGETWVIGPFHPQTFNDADALVQVTYEKVTSLTVGVLKL